MIKFLQKDGRIIGFEMEGHAMFSTKGRDIVCSAISAVSQMTVVGLYHETGIDHVDIETRYHEKAAYMMAKVKNGKENDKSDTLLQTLKKFMTSLQYDYPAHIKIGDVEI
jgi:hypothetical protein